MAEQYASFQGKEPNIDVNLFVNALNQGIAAGNAQSTTAGGIFTGITEGIKTGMSVYSGMQQIEAQDAANEVATDPGVIEAKKKQEVAQGDSAQARAETAKRQNDTAAKIQGTVDQTAQLEAGIQNDQATIKAIDTQAMSDLVKIGTGGNIQAGMQAIQNPAAQGAMARNPQFGQQYVQQLKQMGGDPAILDPLSKQYSEMAYAGKANGARTHLQDLAAKNAAKNSDLAAEMESYIGVTPEFDKYVTKGNFDPRLLDLRATPKKSPNDPTTYDYTYGDEIVKKGAVGKDEYKDYHSKLQAWKTTFRSNAGAPPQDLNTPRVNNQNGAAPSGPQGLHSRMTQPAAPVPQPSKGEASIIESNNFLKGAVTIGKFSPVIVEKAAPAFNNLNKTISELAKGDLNTAVDAQNLKEAVNITSKMVASTIYDTNPAIQAANTMADVENYNKRVTAAVMGNGVTDFKDPMLKFADSALLLETLKVKDPQDLYFATSGAAIVKQMTDFANKAVLARKRQRELQEAKSRGNTSQVNILKDIQDG